MAEQRKLTTIMAVDVAGYSRAAEANESAAAAAVRQVRSAIDAIVTPLGGRVFNTAGDGFMIELPTASAGVEAASQLLAVPDAPHVRIGLHLGEVIVSESGDLLGHGVNVAARLQQMAEPASAIVSQAVQAQIRSGQAKLTPLGEVQLDKMRDRIRVFALSLDPKLRYGRVTWRRARRAVVLLAAIALLCIGGVAAWLAVAPQGAETPRLAVLRLQSADSADAPFAETLADELISYVGRTPGIEVVARASSFALTGDRATPEGAARELAATLVLTGSVRRSDERIAVTAQLAEAPSGRLVWSRDFSRPIGEIQELQSEIATHVARAAGVRAQPRPRRRVDPQAYELYLQGREADVSGAEPGAALGFYEQAVARDPNLAAGWSYLAETHLAAALTRWLESPPGVAISDEWLAPAFSAAERASALDADDPSPYRTTSRAHALMARWREAYADAEAASERGGAVSFTYGQLGYFRKAIASSRRQAALDPLSLGAWNSLFVECEALGDWRCALDAAEHADRLAPEGSPLDLVLALHHSGRTDEALALTRTRQQAWRAAMDENAPWTLDLVRAAIGHGQAPSSERLIASLEGGAYLESVLAAFIALERPRDAVQLLPRWGAAQRPSIRSLYDARLAPLRESPAFWALMEREGLVAFWRDSGAWPDFCEREQAVCARHLRR
jgi:adenylate cyclase